jgi:hypothetical protein
MTDRNIRRELLSLQQTDPTLKTEYDRRIREMMEVELKPAHRRGWIVSGVISILASLQWAAGAVTTWRATQSQWPVHVSFIAVSVASLCWAVLSFSIVRRNRVLRSVHLPWGIGIITILAYVLWITGFLQAEHTGNLSVAMAGLSALVAGGVVIILYRMEQNAFKVQEEQLRTQLQIADLIETIKVAGPN